MMPSSSALLTFVIRVSRRGLIGTCFTEKLVTEFDESGCGAVGNHRTQTATLPRVGLVNALAPIPLTR